MKKTSAVDRSDARMWRLAPKIAAAIGCMLLAITAILPPGCDQQSAPASRTESVSNAKTDVPAEQKTQAASSHPTHPQHQPGKASTSNQISHVDEQLDPALVVPFRLIRQHQTGPARVRLRNHLLLHPDDGQAVFLFGLTYHREKKYGQAMTYFDRALELAPTYATIQHFRGWALFNLGQLEEARQAFEAFLKMKPGEPDSHFGLGLIALDEHDLDTAKRHFQHSIRSWMAEGDKADRHALSKAHARLSEVLEQQGKLLDAQAHLKTAVELHPDAYEAWYRLYRVQVRLGDLQQAEHTHVQYLAAKDRVRPGTSFPE